VRRVGHQLKRPDVERRQLNGDEVMRPGENYKSLFKHQFSNVASLNSTVYFARRKGKKQQEIGDLDQALFEAFI